MNIDPEDVLAALLRARGQGLSLKQLSGQLHLGRSHHEAVRRALAKLLKEGRATYNGHLYRPSTQKDLPQPAQSRPPSRRAPAALVEGARVRREKTP